METTIQNIRLFLVTPSVMNPRKSFDKDSLQDLADNIQRQGLLQPITVRPVDRDVIDRNGNAHGVEYEIVCGERRYRACSLLKMETIPCIVREMTDDEAFDAMITENLQRRDVDPVEEAEAFRLLQERGQTVEDLALRFGKSQRYIRDRMRLVSLSQPLQQSLSAGQIPLRGAYLLSRLSEEDQQEFFKDNLDDGDNAPTVSSDDVEDWIARHFRDLHEAIFQEKGSLAEKWNPDGALIRRCDTCPCNTHNQGCLFADMRTDEPQCTDEQCYQRKCSVYIDWFLSQFADRYVRKGEKPAVGRMHIVDSKPYRKDALQRYEALAEKYSSMGYRLFTEKELDCYYGTPDELLKRGELVEGISLHDLSSQYCVRVRYYRISPSLRGGSAAGGSSDESFMAARLCERKASIETAAQRKCVKFAKEHFDHVEYERRNGTLQEWEMDILAAIVFDQMDYSSRSALIPGRGYGVTTYKEMRQFLAGQQKDSPVETRAWMRRAIVAYVSRDQNKDFLIETASRLSDEVGQFVYETNADAYRRIDSIDEELKAMVRDEHGNKL